MIVKTSLKAALLGSAVFATSMIAHAQDTDTDAEDARELDKVVVVVASVRILRKNNRRLLLLLLLLLLTFRTVG